ncbi:sensor histidine kinase [Gordonia sp. (in: high G+C Gram-positive bacteria)]|uniref:sensor histidine kinase n=1 Tax=Gordonia sp. (in: high G+C Gram-positive bacteria) TaxID=84139 RepID=UPI0039E2BE79
MAWLFERYRHMFALTGYHYPPHYMLIAQAGQLFFCYFAAGQRVVAGLSGWDWLIVAAALVVGAGPAFASIVQFHRPMVPMLPLTYVTTVVLFWLVPVHGDVAPLILVLGATMTSAIVGFRQAVGYVAVYAVAAVAGVVAGGIEQGWLLVLMVCFGGVTGQLLQQQLHAMEAEHREHERQQLVERASIAGEVHDVVAHSLSIVLLNVTAARRALEAGGDRADVDDALEALRDAESQGREAMGDVRRTIELLRDDVSPDTAQPGLGDLDTLIAGFRRAGSTVDCRYERPAEALSPATQLAVYRVVQESLSNASRHAPGTPVSVTARPVDGGFAVRVGNPVSVGRSPRSSGPGTGGLGVTGMASRVENLGGTFRAGVVGEEWVVDARFVDTCDPADQACSIEEVIRGR